MPCLPALVALSAADGNEEQNVSQVLAIALTEGAPAARPAEPRWVEARAIPGGRIELGWLYDPRYEDFGPGAAYEARIYWDAGTGTVDFSEPLATVAMGRPTAAGRWTWQSDALENGQTYLFVVRIATQAWPDGIETQNTNSSSATANASSPLAPVLATQLV